MRRREFITLLGGAAAWPLGARAQEAERPRRISVVNIVAATDPEVAPRVAAFENALRELGWTTEGNLRINYVWGWNAEESRAREIVRQVIDSQPDVIVTVTTPATQAFRDEAGDTPIVFLQVFDPIGTRLVGSLSRPRGTITGFTNFESSMGGKWVELLKEMIPTVSRIALLLNPATSPGAGAFYLQSVTAGSSTLAITLIKAPVRNTDELQEVLAKLSREPNAGLIVAPDAFTTNHRDLIISLAAQYRLPAVYAFRYFVTRGGLFSYGIDTINLFRRAATYVDRILKGTKPADLPVQQPTKFELVINLKTAKALGLEIPPTLLALADEVIE